jgi:hypothetical protein
VGAARAAAEALRHASFEVVIANDAVTLPTALAVAAGRPVVADMHEYAPLEMEEDWRWRLLFQRFAQELCQEFLPRAAAVTTVSAGLAERYRAEFGVTARVVMNAGPRRDSEGSPTGSPIRLVHSGNANPNRRLETMIEAAADLPNVRLDLYLVPAPHSGRYLERLQALAAATSNVRVLDPVPMEQVVPTMESYDIGLYCLAPTSFNNLHALPNKFFDFVQAGLGIVIGPSPDMAALVREHDLGLIADGFDRDSLRSVLAGLEPAAVDRWRANVRSARPTLSSDGQAAILRQVVDDVRSRRLP